MIKAIITDFSWVLLFPKDKNYKDSLNELHKELSSEPGYKLLDHFEINLELLNYYKSLRDKVSLYVFTSETIQDSPELQPFVKLVFKEIYSASKIGISKKEIDAYKQLVSKLGLLPWEILFVDDSRLNINAASKAGLQTILYKNNESLRTELQAKLA